MTGKYKKINKIEIGDFYVQSQFQLDVDSIPPKKEFVRHKLMEIIGIDIQKKEVLVYDSENDMNWIKKATPNLKGEYVFPVKER